MMKPSIRPLILILAVLTCAQASFAKVRFGTTTFTTASYSDNTTYLQYVRYMTVPFSSQNGATWDAGNDTSGKTAAEIQVIVNNIKALETDAVQKEIFTQMEAAPTEWFTFRDVAHAKSVVTQRLETIQMMKNFNADHRYWYWSTAVPVSTSATQWAKGTRVNFYFRQKSGTAYNAIAQICANTSVTRGECLGAIMTCIWYGAAKGMGTASFNALYPGTTALNMDSKTPPGNGSWGQNTVSATDASTLVPGDWGYWKNYNYNQVINERYFYRKSWLSDTTIYYWSGENSLYFGKDGGGNATYAGLGVGPSTVDEMRSSLKSGYNNDLANVISGLAPGGTYNGLTVTTITDADAPVKLTFVSVRRVTN